MHNDAYIPHCPWDCSLLLTMPRMALRVEGAIDKPKRRPRDLKSKVEASKKQQHDTPERRKRCCPSCWARRPADLANEQRQLHAPHQGIPRPSAPSWTSASVRMTSSMGHALPPRKHSSRIVDDQCRAPRANIIAWQLVRRAATTTARQLV